MPALQFRRRPAAAPVLDRQSALRRRERSTSDGPVTHASMNPLVSLLNSGESLEKALVLTRLACGSHPGFYGGFSSVQAYYYENLPKAAPSVPAHGTLGAVLKYLPDAGVIPHRTLSDLWDDRRYLLRRLRLRGRISERMEAALAEDRRRYERTVPHLPWYLLLEECAAALIRRCLADFPAARVESLTVREEIGALHEQLPHASRRARLYFLQPDGGLSSRTFGCRIGRQPSRFPDLAGRSLACSPNVYLFLFASYLRCRGLQGQASIGFRAFASRPRRSYSAALEFLRSGSIATVIEPVNERFNSRLDCIDREHGRIPTEHKINLAIYYFLREILAG